MPYFGKIESYSSSNRAGMICNENGGKALPFNIADLQKSAAEPKADQRFSFETKAASDGKVRAINLQLQI